MAFVPDVIEVISGYPLFDTYSLAANTATPSEIKMFIDPQSSTKGSNLTNLTSPGKLENPRSFLVQAMRVILSPDIAFVDATALMKNYIFKLVVDEDDYAIGNLAMFPAGGGLVSVVATNDATVTKYEKYSNGIQDPRAIAAFDRPVPINQGSSFRVEVKGTSFTTLTGGPGLWFQVYLEGELNRGK